MGILEAQTFFSRGGYEQALNEARVVADNSSGAERVRALNLMAASFSSLGSHNTALETAEEALQESQNLHPDAPEKLETLNNLARLAFRSGDYSRALSLGQDVARQFVHRFGKNDPKTLRVRDNLARYTMAAGYLDLAIPQIESILADWGDTPDSPETLASLLLAAETISRATVLRYEKLYGANHPEALRVRKRLGL